MLIVPEMRGRGAGAAAQRLLVEYLFSTTTAFRIWAATEAENIAEQRALERSGFSQEGRLRGTHFRDGQWRDSFAIRLGGYRLASRLPGNEIHLFFGGNYKCPGSLVEGRCVRCDNGRLGKSIYCRLGCSRSGNSATPERIVKDNWRHAAPVRRWLDRVKIRENEHPGGLRVLP